MRREEKRKVISGALGGIESRYIEEAGQFCVGRKKGLHWKKTAIWAAALLFLVVLAGGISILFSPERAVVYAYTWETNEKLTKAGVVIHTGMVLDDGEQTGHPLRFYLSGEGIQSVRFSCKNQEMIFTDWTEKREEYGLAKNFTILYGEEEAEYPYLTINWEPKETIRRLHENYTITELPQELKEDLIVMEITFMDGSQAVKAIQVSLLSDGTFFAAFDDYEIGPLDSFVEQKDALTLREQTKVRLSERQDKEVAENRWKEEQAENRNQEEESTGDEPETESNEKKRAARKAAEEYYAGTVFEVVSIREKSVSEREMVFDVSVKKDGILQEPDRKIVIQKQGEGWKVVNEGY